MTSSAIQPPARTGSANPVYRKPRQMELAVVPEVDRAVRVGQPAAERDDLAAARRSVHAGADQALEQGPWSVTRKRTASPTGDPHDYFSLSIYYNPNPQTPDGLPYVLMDGKVNPQIEDYDMPAMSRMAIAVQRLSFAYRLTGDPRYARHAANLLRTWFLDPATRMKPHMRFAQYIPGGSDVAGPPTYPPRFVETGPGRGVHVSFGGVIEGCTLVPIIPCAQWIKDSAAWSDADDAGLRAWFAEFLQWLLTSPLGHDEKSTRNNHSTWYCTQIVTYATYVGRDDIARQYLLENVPQRMYSQIDPDGSQPEEMVRANPVGYVCFNLVAFFNLAILGEKRGIDLWNLDPGSNRSLRNATRWLAAYAQAHPDLADRPDSANLLETAALLLRTATHRYNDELIHRAAADIQPPRDQTAEIFYPDQATFRRWTGG